MWGRVVVAVVMVGWGGGRGGWVGGARRRPT